ncbi:MAG: copper resistance protein CopC, partial [Geminicoccaceae bacterium]
MASGRLPRILLRVGLAAALLGPAAVAHAHAVLLETSPAAGAFLERPPQAIILRFNEPVRPIAVQVLRAENAVSIELGAVQAVNAEVRAPLPKDLPGGSYVLSYRVASADGHPVAGSFVFGVGQPGSPGTSALAAGAGYDGFWRLVGVAARSLWYGLLLLAAGMSLALALIRVPRELVPLLERDLFRLAIAGVVAAPLMLAVEGGALLGGAPGSLLTAEPWRLAAGSPVASTVACAFAGLGSLILGRRAPVRARRPVLLAGALLVALSFGLSGHAATAAPHWITVPVLGLHALCAAFWIGALWPLLLLVLRLPRAEAKEKVRAFSSLALPAVACLVFAGTVLAVLQLESWSALATTDYGRRLTLKLVLVAGLLGLAVINRLVLTPALDQRERAVHWLKSTIKADLALAVGVVVLTASLGAVPPPRALAE